MDADTVDQISKVFGTTPSEALMTIEPAKEKVKSRKVKTDEKTSEPKVRAKREGTKQDRAVAIFKRCEGKRKETIAAIVHELAMSEAGATTYFYNAKKLVG